MARESSRLRLARRFGQPERLADMLQAWPCELPTPIPPGTAARMGREAACILGDDVLAGFDPVETRDWSWRRLPPLRLPFSQVLIESALSGGRPGARVGLFFKQGPDPAAAVETLQPLLTGATHLIPTGLAEEEPVYRSASSTLTFRMFAGFPDRQLILPLSAGVAFLDSSYIPVAKPVGECRPDLEQRLPPGYGELACLLDTVYPLAFVLGLMNCRNVRIVDVDPDKALNRKRREANLPPFVRYQRIDIGPVTRPANAPAAEPHEGEGTALHAVRGHFAHFEPDRPMFGRPGLHGDFWITPHLRGDFKRGVIESDYNVLPPDQPPE
jgi:hypothetical protein